MLAIIMHRGAFGEISGKYDLTTAEMEVCNRMWGCVNVLLLLMKLLHCCHLH